MVVIGFLLSSAAGEKKSKVLLLNMFLIVGHQTDSISFVGFL